MLTIGIGGGSGSGKTTVTGRIIGALPQGSALVLQQDHYYKDLSALSPGERAKRNFDHPGALDTPLLVAHVLRLRAGQTIDRPFYDFTSHRRQARVLRLAPHPALLLEGTLVLQNETLRNLMDVKIFVDTDADLRFIRRLSRDTSKRGRAVESVVEQYLATVRPMHARFVEPSKQFADLIVAGGGDDRRGMDRAIRRIRSLLPRSACSERSRGPQKRK